MSAFSSSSPQQVSGSSPLRPEQSEKPSYSDGDNHLSLDNSHQIDEGEDKIEADELTLKKMKSADELKVDFKENEKILTTLSFNIDDLFKKINSLAEEVQNEVQVNPITKACSLKQIDVSPSKEPQFRSQKLIQQIEQEKREFQKMEEKVYGGSSVGGDEERGISMKMFEVGTVLGHGKFGQVLLCRHKLTKTVYALKKIFKSTIEQYGMHEQILTEIKSLQKMNHPNIISPITAFSDEFHIFLLTSYAAGVKLTKKFKSSEGYVSRIIRQVLNALAFMHEVGVSHRDLKPENILIDEYGVVKICDFGWAEILEKGGKQMDIICGTLDYVCPEMVTQQQYSKEVDLWSVGVLTYELIYGVAPFHAQNREKTFQKVKSLDLLFPPEIPVTQHCLDFIRKLLKPESQRMPINQCITHPFITTYPEITANSQFVEFDSLFE